MRCPACYIDLVVPHESTIRAVNEAELYKVDEVPVDVRDMAHRHAKASFPCPVCHAILSITSKDQVGMEIVCPDCDSYVQVPMDLLSNFAPPARNDTIKDQVDHIMGTGPPPIEVYGVSGSAQPQDVHYPLTEKTFPVFCGLCNTLMRATERMIGQTLECPDCGTKTLVLKPKEKEKLATNPLHAGGFATYGVDGAAKIFGLEEFDPNERIVPVVCSLCATRMYASEKQIGQMKTCPDCGTQTLIKDVPEQEKILPQTEGNDYTLKVPEAAQRPPVRAGVDYRNIEGSLDLENQQIKEEKAREAAEKAAEKARKDKKKDDGPLVSELNSAEARATKGPETNESSSEGLSIVEDEELSVPLPKPLTEKSTSLDVSTQFIVQEPFLPTSIPGAKPDAYDLNQQPVARLIPRPPPPPELFADSEEPLHVPMGPRAELVHGKQRPEHENRLAARTAQELRHRRRVRSRAKWEEEEDHRKVKHREPPAKPFFTGVFRPFYRYGFRETLLTVLAIGSIPAAALTYAGPDGFKLFSEGIFEAGAEVTLMYLCFSVIGFFCASYWIAVFCTYLFNLFEVTLNGFDRVELPPDLSYMDGLSAVAKMTLLSFCAVLPGYLLWFLVHLFVLDFHGTELTYGNVFNPVAEIATSEDALTPPQLKMSLLFITFCLVSHWIFYPIVFLSGIESTEQGFTPYSSQTLKSLFSLRTIWMRFYIDTLPSSAVLAIFVFSFHFFGFYHETLFSNGLQFVSILLLGSAAAVMYYRLLGRLAWVIESDTRKHATEESAP